MRRPISSVRRDISGSTILEFGLIICVLGFTVLVSSPSLRNATFGTLSIVAGAVAANNGSN